MFAGKPYSGSRLGLSTVGGSDNIDDWHHEVNARLEDARAAGKPVTVWVNPDNPAESVFDREICAGASSSSSCRSRSPSAAWAWARSSRWSSSCRGRAAGGGAGAGRRDEALGGRAEAGAQAQGNATPRFLWVFAFFWNAMSWPIAFLAVPDIVENGEWAGLLVLLFPLVGLGLLWAAVSATWNAWLARRGGAGPGVARRARPVGAGEHGRPGRARDVRSAGRRGAAAGRPADPDGREPDIPPAIAEVEERAARPHAALFGAAPAAASRSCCSLVGAVLTLIGVGALPRRTTSSSGRC